MTSVAEPFGLTVLEAIRSGVPCIIPKNSGIAEMVAHVLKVDFWDVQAVANNIIAVLKYPLLQQALQYNSYQETEDATWEKVASKMLDVYRQLAFPGVVRYAS
jgi:glycosyltransferase involved in cell wall biosynthesis